MTDISSYITNKATILVESGLPGIFLLVLLALLFIIILRLIVHVVVLTARWVVALFRGPVKAKETTDNSDDEAGKNLFEQGLARERRGDIDGAIRSYEAATAVVGGHPLASFHLANLYFSGEGNARRNPVAAVRHFRKAAMHGITPAMDALSQAYQYGEGVVADPVKAYIWCLVAKAAGVKSAGERQLRYESMLLKDYTAAHLRAWQGEAAILFDKISHVQ